MSLSHLTRGHLRIGLLACHDVLTTTLRAADPLGEFVDGLAGAYGGAFAGQMGALRAALESAGGLGRRLRGAGLCVGRAVGRVRRSDALPGRRRPWDLS